MSNKTQLQTNNTKLDALIARVNSAKDVAASLPEAGGGDSENLESVIAEQEALITELSTALDNKAPGGSGGGSVETCFVTISAHAGTSFSVYGANSTGTFVAGATETEEQARWNGLVIKNSVIVTLGIGAPPQISGNAEILFNSGMPIIIYSITGDCNMTWG